ncbi:MAG: response regulator transcription factor [Roseivirga sp.]|nr:response regulator transcription factor [Roseivirga sp.]
MQKVKVLIVEDETMVANDLRYQLSSLGYEVCAVAKSGEEALRNCEIHQPDLVLMDIKIHGELDGIDTAIKVANSYGIPIIYLSDLKDPATLERAKKSRSFSFLSKPVTEFTLLSSIEFAIKNHLLLSHQAAESFDGLKDYVFIREGNAHTKMPIDSILWLKAAGAYCEIQTPGKIYVQSKNMREVSEYFNPSLFVKAHKSYIVNVTKIDSYEGTEIMINGTKIPIGKTFLQDFKKRLKLI